MQNFIDKWLYPTVVTGLIFLIVGIEHGFNIAFALAALYFGLWETRR